VSDIKDKKRRRRMAAKFQGRFRFLIPDPVI